MNSKTLSHRISGFLKRGLVWLSVFIFALAITGMIYQTAATEADQRKYPPLGILLNVDGYKMHIYCMGEGNPTIILDHVGGGSSMDWTLIQPRLAEHTRVCAYDRAGFGWSDYSPAPRTLENQVNELHSLLEGANEKGPYIFVGHSYGARVGRVFAAKYHEEVTGMVLIDAGFLYDDPRYPAETLSEFESESNMIRTANLLAPFGLVRLLRPIIISDPTFDLPEQARFASTSFAATSRYWKSMDAQGEALPTVFQEERQVTSLGDIPLLVLVSTDPNDVAHQIWRQANIEMADLSTNGSHHIVENATHMSLAYRQTDARVCADGILEVLNAVHDKQSLSQRTE